MKKILAIIISFVFVSCFKEPKNDEIVIHEKTPKKIESTSKNYSILKTQKLDTINSKKEVDGNFIQTLEILVNGSINDFDKWASLNSFYFEKVIDNESFKSYLYDNTFNNRLLIYNTRDDLELYSIYYETTDNKEYLLLEKNCQKEGYLKKDVKNYNGTLIYFFTKNKKYELSFNSETVYRNNKSKIVYTIAIENILKNKI